MFISGIHKAVLLGYLGDLPFGESDGEVTVMASPVVKVLQGKALGHVVLGHEAPDHP